MTPAEVSDALARAGCKPRQSARDGVTVAKCPSCSTTGALEVRRGDDGRPSFACAKGCPASLVAAALEIDPSETEPVPRQVHDLAPVAPRSWPENPPPVSRRVPPFPLDALPEVLGEYVADLSVALQTPPDLAGLLSLSAVAAAVARRVRLQVRPDWQEPVNIYVAVILPPAARKSPVFSAVTKPLREFERTEAARTAASTALMQSKLEIAEKRLKKAIEQAAAEPNGGTEEIERLTAEKMAIVVPPKPRLVADDCTPERLAMLLAEQGGRMAVMSAEGGVFELMAGRYSDKGANLDVYLKGHCGDDLRVDRVGRAEDYVQRPAITFGLAIQPDVLRSLRDQPGFRGRGLLGRFLYALPENTVGWRETNPPPLSPDVATRYERMLLGLLELPPAQSPEGDQTEHALRLSTGARAALEGFMSWLEPKLRPGGELEHIGDWGGKLAGAVARLAALLHLAENNALPFGDVSAERMEQAIRLGRYLLAHAQAAFDEIGSDPAVRAARAIHALLSLSSPPDSGWTKREVHQRLRKRVEFQKRDSLTEGFALLEDLGWIEVHDQTRGGRPTGCLVIHPLLTGSKGSKAGWPETSEPFEPERETGT